MVCLYSWYTLSYISWQPIQNSSLFVASIPVLNPPQKMMPAKKDTVTMPIKEYFALGLFRKIHVRFKTPGLLSITLSIANFFKFQIPFPVIRGYTEAGRKNYGPAIFFILKSVLPEHKIVGDEQRVHTVAWRLLIGWQQGRWC